MALKTMLQNNPAAAVAVAILVLGLAAWIARRGGADVPAKANMVYFYDLGTGSLFEADSGATPPIESPSGSVGVSAAVFACGACDNADARFIGYLEKLETQSDSDEMKSFVAAVPESGEPKWLPMGAPAANAVVQATMQRCGNNPEAQLTACKP